MICECLLSFWYYFLYWLSFVKIGTVGSSFASRTSSCLFIFYLTCNAFLAFLETVSSCAKGPLKFSWSRWAANLSLTQSFLAFFLHSLSYSCTPLVDSWLVFHIHRHCFGGLDWSQLLSVNLINFHLQQRLLLLLVFLLPLTLRYSASQSNPNQSLSQDQRCRRMRCQDSCRSCGFSLILQLKQSWSVRVRVTSRF